MFGFPGGAPHGFAGAVSFLWDGAWQSCELHGEFPVGKEIVRESRSFGLGVRKNPKMVPDVRMSQVGRWSLASWATGSSVKRMMDAIGTRMDGPIRSLGAVMGDQVLLGSDCGKWSFPLRVGWPSGDHSAFCEFVLSPCGLGVERVEVGLQVVEGFLVLPAYSSLVCWPRDGG